MPASSVARQGQDSSTPRACQPGPGALSRPLGPAADRRVRGACAERPPDPPRARGPRPDQPGLPGRAGGARGTAPFDSSCSEPATSADRRLTVRFGDAILAAGHTAVPNLVLRYYAKLGISDGEMMFTLQVWSHWWTARDPHPSIQTIAARMGKKERQVQYYVQGLRDKGFLQVVDRFDPTQGGQLTSEYDYSPLIAAVVGRARADRVLVAGDEAATVVRRARPPAQSHPPTPGMQHPAPPPAHQGAISCTPPSERNCAPPAQLLAPKEDESQENKTERRIDFDSMPPTPIGASGGQHERERSSTAYGGPPANTDQPAQTTRGRTSPAGTTHGPLEPHGELDEQGEAIARALLEPITALADEFGDQAPAASTVRRARNLFDAAGVGLDVFLDRLAEAAERTRVHRERITGRHRDSPVANCMPYLFAVLENLPDRERSGSDSAARSWRRSRVSPAVSREENVSRYTMGPYGVCPHCLSSPCEDDCPSFGGEEVEPASAALLATRASSPWPDAPAPR